MGFGLLFIGYFTATLMSINKIGFFLRIIGYSIVLTASNKLSKYNRAFSYMSVAAVLMIIVSLFLAGADISEFLYEQLVISTNPLGETYRGIFGYVEMAMSFVFHTAMLCAIRSIAIETGVDKNAVAAIRNFIFTVIYYILNVLGMLIPNIAKYLAAPTLLLYFVLIILNLILIYSCYARICDESDVDMEQKPSRFAFVNKMRAQAAQRREEADKRREEYKNSKRKK